MRAEQRAARVGIGLRITVPAPLQLAHRRPATLARPNRVRQVRRPPGTWRTRSMPERRAGAGAACAMASVPECPSFLAGTGEETPDGGNRAEVHPHLAVSPAHGGRQPRYQVLGVFRFLEARAPSRSPRAGCRVSGARLGADTQRPTAGNGRRPGSRCPPCSPTPKHSSPLNRARLPATGPIVTGAPRSPVLCKRPFQAVRSEPRQRVGGSRARSRSDLSGSSANSVFHTRRVSSITRAAGCSPTRCGMFADALRDVHRRVAGCSPTRCGMFTDALQDVHRRAAGRSPGTCTGRRRAVHRSRSGSGSRLCAPRPAPSTQTTKGRCRRPDGKQHPNHRGRNRKPGRAVHEPSCCLGMAGEKKKLRPAVNMNFPLTQ